MKRILVATDFSELSGAAVKAAADLARQAGGRLTVLHVMMPGEASVTDALIAIADELRNGVDVETALALGDPAEEIVRHARRHEVDLVVLGTHGRTGVTRALLGSVAERVVRTSCCPVLTVPEAGVRVPASAPEPAQAQVSGRCLVCAERSVDLICAPCRAHIRGEAIQHKQREERAGRV